MSELPEPIPAATLILMRRAEDGGAPELLITERADTMAFAAGALVFPGGRIDPDDHLAALAYPEHGDSAARIAAVRETIEETGLAPALPPLAGPRTQDLRDRLRLGTPFSALLESERLSLDLSALTPFARWCPNFRETRRFDTLFYLAEAPTGSPQPSADEAEAVRAFWGSAARVLEELDAGRAHAIFPTRRNLERLARFSSIEEARADAQRFPIEKITPWVEERAGEKWVCIPEHIGYPVTAEPLATARRR